MCATMTHTLKSKTMPEFFEGEELEAMLQDTLYAIEYAIGDKTSEWGSLRAQMGHPEPFRLNYIEIGNENSGEVYEVRYRKFYDAIRKRYPHIQNREGIRL